MLLPAAYPSPEKGGKRHEMPCHHSLDEYLQAYVEGAQLGADPKGWMFRTAIGRNGQLSERPMTQADVYCMIRWRAEEAGSAPGSAAIRSGPLESRSISATASSSRSRSRWPSTSPLVRRVCMMDATITYRLTR